MATDKCCSEKDIGIVVLQKEKGGDVRCLCPKCLNDYIHDPNYIVRRADPFAKKKTSAISAAAAGGIISYMTGVIPLRKEGCSDEPLFREYENSEIRHPSLA